MPMRYPAELIVELPGGLIDADGRRNSTVTMRTLTGAEEDWLAANPHAPSAVCVTHLLTACVRCVENAPSDRDLIRRLLVGDRDYLMLQLRRISLGDKISAVLACPACNSKMDVDFLVQDVPVQPRPQTAATYMVEHNGQTVWFRMPTGGDQEAVVNMDSSAAADALLARCLVGNGSKPISPDVRLAVTAAMDTLAPRVELELNLTCPECSHSFVTEFDTTAFFLHEMRSSGHRLLEEAHLLALYYHWSEAEIMSLRRDRRRTYLAFISDAVRPA